MSDITLKEAIGDSKVISVNFTRLKQKAKECKERENNMECRRQLKDLGIDFIGD